MNNEPRLIRLPIIPDNRGNLSFIEEGCQTSFPIQRLYWIYDVPGGETRDGHAYKKNRELIVALSGSFDIEIFDGKGYQTFTLNRSYNALEIPPGIWREINNFSSNAIALVIASEPYNESDYIRDIESYKQMYDAD